MASWYVKRSSSRNAAGFAFVGPIGSEAQAAKEAEAWKDAGETVEVLASTPAVRHDVRLWDRVTHAEDAGELVFYQGQQLTMATYRLRYEQ